MKLVRVNAWVMRFVDNCRLPKELRDSGELSVDEIYDSEVKIVRVMQKEEFTTEYRSLTKKKTLSTSSRILSLYPRLDDDGLIRSNGRLEHAEYLNYDAKYPIILPRGHWITQLIVKHYHEMGNHTA